jgi:TolB-like protein/Tfp pilus assembly protein PilF
VWRSPAPGVSAPVIQAVTVLPLQNLSGDAEQEYFVDGMTEALITDLSKIGALRFISRSSAMRYKGTSKTLAQIGRELRVDALVEGSVVRDGSRVGVTARLIEAASDRTLWAGRFEREVRSILALQGEIARPVARRVEVTLTPEEQSRLTNAREVDPNAYEAYLKGSFHVQKLTPEGIEKGLAYLRDAAEKDPASALAHAGLALGYSLAASHSTSPPKDAFRGRKPLTARRSSLTRRWRKATRPSPRPSSIGSGTGRVLRRPRRAIELNPSLARAHVHYSWYLNLVGRQDEAVAEMTRARQLDPLDPTWAAWFGDLQSYAGRYDEAVVAGREAVELGPTHHWSYEALGLALAGKGLYEEAIAAHRRAAELNPGWRGALALTYAKAGMRDKALEIIPELENRKDRLHVYLLPSVCAALGDHDRALRWTEAAIEARNPFAPWLFTWINVVGHLRGQPRYQALRVRMGLPPSA